MYSSGKCPVIEKTTQKHKLMCMCVYAWKKDWKLDINRLARVFFGGRVIDFFLFSFYFSIFSKLTSLNLYCFRNLKRELFIFHSNKTKKYFIDIYHIINCIWIGEDTKGMVSESLQSSWRDTTMPVSTPCHYVIKHWGPGVKPIIVSPKILISLLSC